MKQAEVEDQFHTVDEFKAALAFGEAEWTYLRRLARNRCRVRRQGEEDEVIEDAIYRVLEGKRRWPKSLNLFAFLSGVMKSIMSENPKIGFRRKIEQDIKAAADAVSEDASAATLVLETEVLAYETALFEEDADAKALAEGIMEGWEKDDLPGLFDGDVTRCETVRKRFKRRTNSHPELKSMIHGE